MEFQIDILKAQLKDAKYEVHKLLLLEYKSIFRFMDILMALIILFNFGAVFTTNMMVMKAEPNRTFMEVNPVQVKVNDLAQHPQSASLMFMIFKQAILWFLMVLAYIFYRHRAYTRAQMLVLLAVVITYAILTCWDMTANAGFALGRMVYG